MVSKMVTYVGLFILFLVLFSLYGFWVAVHPPKYITNLTPKDLGWEFEEVTLTSEDGVKLSSWFVPSLNTPPRGSPFGHPRGESDKVIIQLHGYPADKANLLYWSEFLHEDFNLLFLDFRYFGQSDGSLTTIGYREQDDLKTAMEYLEKRGFTKIGAMGFSLGGAVAILTASKDDRLKTVVSDSSFASMDLMAYEFYSPFLILKYPLTFLTKIWAQIFLGINPNEIAPEKAAQSLKIPILLIHSKKDQTIPFENALRIQKALSGNPKAEYFFLEEGIHGALPTYLQEEYERRVIEFFYKNLK